MVAFDAAVAVGAPGADEALCATEAPDARAEVLGTELRAIVGGDFTQPPARGGEFCGDAVQQLAGVSRTRVALRGMQLGPAEGRGDVNRGVLPDGALGARQAPDVEAVELDLLARLGGVDVTLRRRQIGLAFVAIAMASDQDQALGTVSSPTRQSTRQTPCSLIRMPPDFSPASSALIRRGPQPGRASAKAMIRPSGCGPIWLGIGGRRRSLTLSASRPQRSTRFFRR